MAAPSRLDSVISLAKRRGFVFPCGDIYGGTRSAWDYGPLGVELKENIKKQWWQYMVRSREDVVGLDSSVILPRQTWVASGHVKAFTDPLVECTSCHKRLRADNLQEAHAAKHGLDNPDNVALGDVACPNCGTRGQFTEPRAFSGLLKTYLGPVDDESGLHYLRPETAQGIFINYGNVAAASRKKPPFPRGTHVGVFLILYGLCRFLIEFVRQPDIQLGYLLGTNWLTMGQVLSLPLIAVGVGVLVFALTKKLPQQGLPE